MGIEGAFISINIKSSERKSSMLEKSMGKSALMVALVTGWQCHLVGVHSTRGRTKSSIYVRSNGSNSNEDRKKRC